MESTPQLGTAADLEMRAARIADPGIGMFVLSNDPPLCFSVYRWI